MSHSYNSQAELAFDFEIAPEGAIFETSRHGYFTEFRHVNRAKYRPEIPRGDPDNYSWGYIQIMPDVAHDYSDPHARRLQVCPGGCNEGTWYESGDYDVNYGTGISFLSDEAITAILHDRTLAHIKAMHPQRVPLIEIVATRVKWSTPIPAYFSVSKSGIMPHSSAVTLAHLALIQARGHVDKIEVLFRTHYGQQEKVNQDTHSHLQNAAKNLINERSGLSLKTGKAKPPGNSDDPGSLFSKPGAKQKKSSDINTSSTNLDNPSTLFNKGAGHPFKTTFSTNLALSNPFDKATHHRQQDEELKPDSPSYFGAHHGRQGEEVIKDTRSSFQAHYQQDKNMNRDPHSYFPHIKAIGTERSTTKRKLHESALYSPINIKRRKLANKAISDGFGGNSGGSIPRDKVNITARSEELNQNTHPQFHPQLHPQFQIHRGQQDEELDQDTGSSWLEKLFQILLQKKNLLMGYGLVESFLNSE
ncbi:hypothetical protein F4680DRAFT_446898 [Xylaria scruposa]|nr:hypothetical protein F4680DRAFT_446898 [Xylaria scruposa]